jgi:hypothetical protein
MKNLLFVFGAVLLISNVNGQSILTEKEKYKVKRLPSNKGYEAIVPLVCGDSETNKDVTIWYGLDSLSAETADTMYQLVTLFSLNNKSKYLCKNAYSWKPSQFTIMHNNQENIIRAFVKGSAENAYGSRGEVNFYYRWKNGQFEQFKGQ